jgi:hypothetical protein
MEGGCVYIDKNNFATLLMYKEINKEVIFFVKYNFLEFHIDYINIFDFQKMIPNDCIFILSYLPYTYDLDITLKLWQKIAFNRLNYLNNYC